MDLADTSFGNELFLFNPGLNLLQRLVISGDFTDIPFTTGECQFLFNDSRGLFQRQAIALNLGRKMGGANLRLKAPAAQRRQVVRWSGVQFPGRARSPTTP